MEERILVVDDEEEITNLVVLYLQNEGFMVDPCYSGKQALRKITDESICYDLAILDIMLPDVDGFTLCRTIRKRYNYPVIMLTAKGEVTDKITGLTIGADDYITKPFLPLEMVARVKAQIRRYKKYDVNSDEISVRGLVIDQKSHTCRLNGDMLSLTNAEFQILEMLVMNIGNAVPSEELLKAISGSDYYNKNNNTISVHIRHLREKMGDSFEDPRYIMTVWGTGYKIEKETV
ncbi:MAG: response regulator transcription factor [Eubacteriaceae bacterium]|jgi:two-component system response regulator VanR|nr:response regulator transcription factor [Eubacteriaceae bacterium]